MEQSKTAKSRKVAFENKQATQMPGFVWLKRNRFRLDFTNTHRIHFGLHFTTGLRSRR